MSKVSKKLRNESQGSGSRSKSVVFGVAVTELLVVARDRSDGIAI